VSSTVAICFDLFGTLVEVDQPERPALAVADALEQYGVSVPADWTDAYTEPHIDAPEGAEVPLPAHVSAALASRGVEPTKNAARRAVVSAFDPTVDTRPGAVDAVEAAHEHGPVGLLSNCSVPELVGRTLIRSELSRASFDRIVSSVACGWRKPDRRAFETVAEQLSVPVDRLVYVGDTPATDGGIEAVGGTFIDVNETPLSQLPNRFSEVSRK
jgi:HAD superfamily hydrolase (TIGR01549 family)